MNEDRLNKWFASRKSQREFRHSDELAERILSGDKTALSAGITLLESNNPQDAEMAGRLIEKCLPLSGHSLRVGITGVPGVGKSSFIEVFGQAVIDAGFKLCVLTIDPSSEKTGGSILGDKTRMEKLSMDPRAYIRPSASGNELGGVARATRETIILCEAAGYDFLVIETVGVGQSETLVHSMVDFFLLLLLAGAGDELQGIKRGIMEMADGLAVTKADGDNKKRANVAAGELRNAIHLFPPSESGWIPEVKTCSSLQNESIDSILAMILRFSEHVKIKGYFEKNRRAQEQYRMKEALHDLILKDLDENEAVKKATMESMIALENGEITAYQAAKQIYTLYRRQPGR